MGFFSGVPTPVGQESGGFFTGADSPAPSSNQYGQLPGTTQASAPGTVAPSGLPVSTYTAGTTPGGGGQVWGSGQTQTENAVDPQLQNALNNYLLTQVGQGASPFSGSTVLPSSGQATAPGTLNAPTNATLQDLQNFFAGKGSTTPGLNALGDVASKGVSSLPAWDAMVAAQQKNIAEGAAQLREQFNTEGNLSSSPFATGMGDYYNQAILNQNATLAQMQLQGIQTQVQAATTLEQAQQSLGQLFQGMDQQAIQNLLQEFIRTQPEYSPLLNILYSASNTYSPLAGKSYGVGASGAVASGAASAINSIASAWPGSSGDPSASGQNIA